MKYRLNTFHARYNGGMHKATFSEQVRASRVFAMLLFAITPIYIFSCGNGQKEEKEPDIKQETESFIYVDTMILHQRTFNRQLVCNGRLSALQKTDLNMPVSGVLKVINIKEGQRVEKGAVIAAIDDRDQALALERANRDMERARVELQDKLIGLGYSGMDDNIPADVLERAEVTSGYYSAKYELQAAQSTLNDCKLVAPFSGKVANVEGRLHQRTDKLCTLIDDSFFDVDFKILEAELASMTVGTRIKVSPFIAEDQIFEGAVTEINPTVDDRGLIEVKARIKNTSDMLLDGMNVRVVVENTVPDMFVVPKDAVVERDGYHVIFLYENGRTVWTYVDIVYSNINEYAIAGSQKKETTIHDGDIVITSGNLNLADDTEVKINEE